jgi:hypothetical protein
MKSQNRILCRVFVTCLLTAGLQFAYGGNTSVMQSASDGKCLYFDGVDDVVNVGNVSAFDGSQQLTTEMWVRIDKFNAWRTFFCKFKNLGNRIQFQQYSEPGKIAVVVNNGADVEKEGNQGYFYTPGPEVTIGDWFHLAMVFDGTLAENERLKMYINGSVRPLKKDGASKGTVPTRMPSTNTPLLLGAETSNGNHGFKGLMDEIRIWTVARTAAQIQANMERKLSGKEEGLRLYFTIDASDDSAKTLIDRTINKQAVKLVNFDLKTCFIDRDVAIPATAASEPKVEEPSPDGIRIAWVRGSGSANLVFATDRDTGLPNPQAGFTYTANSEYGKGSCIGETNWYCVYNGYEAEVSVSGLTPATDYRLSVVDYNGAPCNEQYKVDSLAVISVATAAAPIVEKKPQVITFTLDSMVTEGHEPIALNGEANSSLPVKYHSSDTTIAKITDDTLNVHAPGVVVITASQAGDDSWLPAADIAKALVVKELPKVSSHAQEPVKGARTSMKTKPFLLGAVVAIATGIVISVITAAVSGSHDDGGNSPAVIDDRPPHDPGFGIAP